ncbi:hypothetical protein OAP56_04225 [Rickettsiaceae bacterium]|nr:hypothetical protein [Rickettsiaceae bacterium]
MSVFLAVLTVFVAIFLSFSDRVIEYFAPNSSFSKISDDVEEILRADD